jgi:hypothetical protein
MEVQLWTTELDQIETPNWENFCGTKTSQVVDFIAEMCFSEAYEPICTSKFSIKTIFVNLLSEMTSKFWQCQKNA